MTLADRILAMIAEFRRSPGVDAPHMPTNGKLVKALNGGQPRENWVTSFEVAGCLRELHNAGRVTMISRRNPGAPKMWTVADDADPDRFGRRYIFGD